MHSLLVQICGNELKVSYFGTCINKPGEIHVCEMHNCSVKATVSCVAFCGETLF